MKSFNINNTVKVKLTEFGKDMLELDHITEWTSLGMPDKFPYKAPKEDKDGYVKFQLWELMYKLGKYCALCREMPFDTVILIGEKDLMEIEND